MGCAVRTSGAVGLRGRTYHPEPCDLDPRNPDQTNGILYEWTAVIDPKELRGVAIVIVHPNLAGYDPILGVLPHKGSEYVTPSPVNEAEHWVDRNPGYRLESY